MLGDLIGEFHGKTTGLRVLDAEGLKTESSATETGKVLGHGTNLNYTFQGSLQADGTISGEGRGFLMTDDGELVTWRGSGVGKFTGPGGATSWRGAVYFQTNSKKLSRLNATVGVYEYEIDASQNSHGKFWEWK